MIFATETAVTTAAHRTRLVEPVSPATAAALGAYELRDLLEFFGLAG